MEIFLGFLLFVPYMVLKFHLTDHETKAEKDFTRYAEGIQYFKNGETELAFAYFDNQVKANRKSAVAYAFRGRCNLRQENYYSAIYDLSEAISFDSTLAECYLDKGRAHMALVEYKEAFLEFDKAVWFFRNESADALRLRGLSRLRMQQFSQSERDLVRAAELGDEDSRFILTQAPFYRVLETRV